VVVLPIISALIAFACVGVIARDAVRRPSPDRITWIIAFGLFGIAAASEAIGDIGGWSAPLVRVYYLTGAVLVVGFLALGQLYLLAGQRIRRVAPGSALLLTAISASTAWGAPIDRSRLDADGWDAIERTTGLTVLAIGINSVGTVILLGGLLYAVVRYRRSGTHPNRMIGCLLIALGTIAVAMGGTLTRLGSDQYLYIAMSIGIALIFAGYVEARGREPVAAARTNRLRFGLGSDADRDERPLRTGIWRKPNTEYRIPTPPAIAYIESRLAQMSDADLSEECRVWSVTARDTDAFTRAEARRVWSFRTRLTPAGQADFDNRPAALRLQLAELYFDVMAIEITPIAPIDRLAARDQPGEAPRRVSTGSVD
jgi:hypothetical protein